VGAAAAASLELFVRAGGGLWLFPAGRGEARGCQSLGRWLPVSVAAAPEPEAARGLRVEAVGSFASWREFELDKVALTRRLELAPGAGGKVWLRSPSGRPCWSRPGTAPAAWWSGEPVSTRSPAISRSSRPSRRWSRPRSPFCASREPGHRPSRSGRVSPSSGPGRPGTRAFASESAFPRRQGHHPLGQGPPRRIRGDREARPLCRRGGRRARARRP